MDIKKEREAFERLPLAELAIKSEYVYYNEETNSYWPNEDFCPSDAPETMNFAWEAWQAAKAQAENITEKLESTANFMRGMCFDPRLHHDIRDAILERVSEIDSFIEAQEPAND